MCVSLDKLEYCDMKLHHRLPLWFVRVTITDVYPWSRTTTHGPQSNFLHFRILTQSPRLHYFADDHMIRIFRSLTASGRSIEHLKIYDCILRPQAPHWIKSLSLAFPNLTKVKVCTVNYFLQSNWILSLMFPFFFSVITWLESSLHVKTALTMVLRRERMFFGIPIIVPAGLGYCFQTKFLRFFIILAESRGFCQPWIHWM